jgi:uncharacterized protein (TIGR03085 family)
MSSHARAQRQELADLLLEVGPDAPTLCGGWTAADLAAHLVIRSRRPDAAAGILVKPLASYTKRVQDGVRRGTAWPQLVESVRTGPPFPLNLNPVDEAVNTVEYFVHLEDVRRALPGWEPRALDPDLERVLWSRLKSMSRLLLRKAPVGVTLVAPGYGQVTGKSGDPHVTVTGPPGELLLFVFGRQDNTRVDLAGDADAAARLRRADLGL